MRKKHTKTYRTAPVDTRSAGYAGTITARDLFERSKPRELPGRRAVAFSDKKNDFSRPRNKRELRRLLDEV